MWSYFNHRDSRNELPDPPSNSGSPARRRRRPLFAGAEPLENRALLSATGNDSPIESISAIELSNSLPPVATEISSMSIAEKNLESSRVFAPMNLTHGAEVQFNSDFGNAESDSSLSDQLFASIAQSAPLRTIPITTAGISNFPFSSFADETRPTVELRVAETGQLLAVGSVSSVQDSNGLTINNDGSPTTYLQTIDADGHAHSQFAFVTQAGRPAPIVEPQSSDTMNDVVVGETEVMDESLSDESVARPDLHDLETALDATNQPASPASPRDGSPQSLAAATRTRWVQSSRTSVANDREARTAIDSRRDAASGQSTSRDGTNNDSDSDFDESSAMPVFDPTTRNIAVSICLLGSLARATARRRRRMKIALAR